uniref:Uncharacterized protein n=1 Tax=Helianthus annuus TaxID=4232 RepID=A0A251TAT8_HELAN
MSTLYEPSQHHLTLNCSFLLRLCDLGVSSEHTYSGHLLVCAKLRKSLIDEVIKKTS